MAEKKKYALYQVVAGCENDVIWAKPSKNWPRGNYPVSECDQEELAYLYDVVGQTTSISKIDMTKDQLERYNKAKEKRENSGAEKKGTKGKQ